MINYSRFHSCSVALSVSFPTRLSTSHSEACVKIYTRAAMLSEMTEIQGDHAGLLLRTVGDPTSQTPSIFDTIRSLSLFIGRKCTCDESWIGTTLRARCGIFLIWIK
jgi:hypothetical protein